MSTANNRSNGVPRSLGERMRARRLELPCTKLEVMAEALDISPSRISEYERGLANVPPHRLPQIAKYLGCSVTHLHYGQEDPAVSQKAELDRLNRQVEEAPSEPLAYYARGYWLLGHDRYAAALEDFNKALEQQSDFAPAYNGRASTYYKMGEYPQALRDCDEAIRNGPPMYIYYLRGHINSAAGNLLEAIEDYGHTIRIDPCFFLAYQDRAATYRELGRYEEALRDLRRVSRLPGISNERAARARLSEGFVLQQLRRWAEARETLQQALAFDSTLSEARELLAKLT